jgi:3-hydroxymyristoyl/3-hydroxydecanoyl-(acyl carrier protein) dehydratase
VEPRDLACGEDEPFVEVVRDGDGGRALVRREHAQALCAGHFPGDPFLPGAYLVELMASLAERVAAPARVAAVVRCAFARRVRPDGEIVVTARAAGRVVEARLESGGELAAHATLRLA